MHKTSTLKNIKYKTLLKKRERIPIKWKTRSCLWTERGFPGGSDSKESTHNARDLGLIPGLARSPGEENGYPLQYPCLENSMDGGTSWATVLGVTMSRT